MNSAITATYNTDDYKKAYGWKACNLAVREFGVVIRRNAEFADCDINRLTLPHAKALKEHSLTRHGLGNLVYFLNNAISIAA